MSGRRLERAGRVKLLGCDAVAVLQLHIKEKLTLSTQ